MRLIPRVLAPGGCLFAATHLSPESGSGGAGCVCVCGESGVNMVGFGGPRPLQRKVSSKQFV